MKTRRPKNKATKARARSKAKARRAPSRKTKTVDADRVDVTRAADAHRRTETRPDNPEQYLRALTAANQNIVVTTAEGKRIEIIPATGALVVPDVNAPDIARVREKVTALCAQIEKMTVVDDVSKAEAVNMIGTLGAAKAEADKVRKGYVEPLKKFTGAVDAMFRGFVKPLDDANEGLRGKVLAFNEAERKRIADLEAEQTANRLRAEALAREAEKAEGAGETALRDGLLNEAAAADAKATEAGAALAGAAPPPARYSTPWGVSSTSRMVWTYEVTALDDVPREFLTVNDALVEERIAAGVREIPGLRIFEREALTVRGR